jgi:ABC-type microcin C transport system duplicated ATPase subunit YejF
VYAVDGVDFEIMPGETFALVGESGCGKTTLGRTIIQLTQPTAGRVVFDGYEFEDVAPEDMRPLRRRMQIIFQDPFGSLNPRMPVSDIIGEGCWRRPSDRAARDKRSRTLELWACGGSTPGATRTSSPAASGSGSGSPGRSRWAPTSSSPTSRFRRSTSRSRARC